MTVAAKLILGKYEPRGEVGAGGSGSVIEAWDTVILRKVAIKCIALDVQPEQPAEPARSSWGAEPAQRAQHARPSRPLQPVQPDARQAAEPSAFAEDGSRVFVLPWEDEEDAFARFERTNPTKVVRQAPVQQAPAPPVLQAAPSKAPAYAVTEQTPGLEEARAVAKLIDENIVTLYDFGVEDNTAFLVMEYVEGVTLKKFLEMHDAELTLDTIAAVFDSVAHALEVAHANKVLHLDIKPDNILINRQGQVKVTDFGLASLTDFHGFGHTGGGTIGYMPPEQMHREALDARCDEWAFASILYQMLVGENPFVVPAHNPLTFEDLERAEAAIRETDLVLPSYLWDELNPAADDVLFRALDPDREKRFRSIAEFADAMAPLLGDPDAGYGDVRGMMAADAAAAESLMARELPRSPEAGSPGVMSGDELVDDPASEDGRSGLRGLFGKFKRAREERRQNAQLEREMRRRDLRENSRDADYDDYYPERYEPSPDRRGPAYEEQLELPYDEYEQEPRPERPRRNPLRLLKSEKVFAVLGRIFAAVGSAFVATIGYANIPQFGGFDNPVFLIVLACFAVAGLLVPSISAGLAFLLLAAALCVNGSYVLGALLVVATVGWWFVCARHGKARTNTALAFPFMGAFGFAQVAPLLAGYCLRTLEALVTTVYGILIALTLAGFGTADLLNWDAVTYFHIHATSVQGTVLSMLTLPQTWCIIVSWLLATAIVALSCIPQKRVLAGFACIVGLLVILLGLCAAQWITSGQMQVFPPTAVSVPTLLFGVVIIAAAFTKVPERSRDN